MATEQVVFVAKAKPPGGTKASELSRFLNKYFYFCMSLLVAAVVVYGFSHTVNDDLLHATPPRPRRDPGFSGFMEWCFPVGWSSLSSSRRWCERIT
jgi:hypothetical protein